MERALLVTVDFRKDDSLWSAKERSTELGELARSVGAEVIREEIVNRDAPVPACFIGRGKAEELCGVCSEGRVQVVIFNNDLTATQQKNLEGLIGVKAIDRTQLILDIFARRAFSNEGKIQVELAQLLYLLPRLTGKGIMLSRLGGGIGTRGPGEQKLETDRRKIRQRITKLKRDLQDLRARRAMMRKHRKRFAALTVSIVGYTNAGKSTLLNALTQSHVMTQDKLFSTLDPTVRGFTLPNKQNVLFVDTVGFLNNLPVHLIEAFKATLEEVVESDVIVHLIDISHPKAREQAEAVYAILRELGVSDTPIIPILNKIDLVNERVIEKAQEEFGQAEPVSALQRIGLERLIGKVSSFLEDAMTTVTFKIPNSDMKTLSLIHENGRVISVEYGPDAVSVKAVMPSRIKEMLEKRLSPRKNS